MLPLTTTHLVLLGGGGGPHHRQTLATTHTTLTTTTPSPCALLRDAPPLPSPAFERSVVERVPSAVATRCGSAALGTGRLRARAATSLAAAAHVLSGVGRSASCSQLQQLPSVETLTDAVLACVARRAHNAGVSPAQLLLPRELRGGGGGGGERAGAVSEDEGSGCPSRAAGAGAAGTGGFQPRQHRPSAYEVRMQLDARARQRAAARLVDNDSPAPCCGAAAAAFICSPTHLEFVDYDAAGSAGGAGAGGECGRELTAHLRVTNVSGKLCAFKLRPLEPATRGLLRCSYVRPGRLGAGGSCVITLTFTAPPVGPLAGCPRDGGTSTPSAGRADDCAHHSPARPDSAAATRTGAELRLHPDDAARAATRAAYAPGQASPPWPGSRDLVTELVLVPERGPLLRVPVVCSASMAVPVFSVGRPASGADIAQLSRTRNRSHGGSDGGDGGGDGGGAAGADARPGTAFARVAASEASRAALAAAPLRLLEDGAIVVGDVVTRRFVLTNAGAQAFHAQLAITPARGAPHEAGLPPATSSLGDCSAVSLSPSSVDVAPFSTVHVQIACTARRAGAVRAALRVALSAPSAAGPAGSTCEAATSSPLQRALLREAVVALEAAVVDPPIYAELRLVETGVCLEGEEYQCTLTVCNRGSAGRACTPSLALAPALQAALGPPAAAAALAAARSMVTCHPASAVVQAATLRGSGCAELVPGRFDFTLTLRPPPEFLTAPRHHALRCATLLAPEAADGGGAAAAEAPGGVAIHRALLAVPLRVSVAAQPPTAAPVTALLLATVTPSQLRLAPAVVDLGECPRGAAVSQRVEVFNPSGVPQRVCFPSLPPHVRVLHGGGGGGGGGGWLGLAGARPAVSVLPPGGRATVRVVFTAPPNPGAASGGEPAATRLRLLLRSSAATSSMELPAVVTVTAPLLELQPASLQLPPLADATTAAVVVIRNVAATRLQWRAGAPAEAATPPLAAEAGGESGGGGDGAALPEDADDAGGGGGEALDADLLRRLAAAMTAPGAAPCLAETPPPAGLAWSVVPPDGELAPGERVEVVVSLRVQPAGALAGGAAARRWIVPFAAAREPHGAVDDLACCRLRLAP